MVDEGFGEGSTAPAPDLSKESKIIKVPALPDG
jgi:hypothetical protein